MFDKMLRGSITDMESGESFEVEHYLLFTHVELTTIIKITEVNSWVYPNDSIQVSIDCEALDFCGGVFDVNLEFTPDSVTERDEILKDFKIDSILAVKGKYGVSGDAPITLSDVECWPVEPQFSENEIREAFRINSKKMKKLESD